MRFTVLRIKNIANKTKDLSIGKSQTCNETWIEVSEEPVFGSR